MKIYNKLVIDIESGDILYEDSFEYEGPVALCDDGGGGDFGGESEYGDTFSVDEGLSLDGSSAPSYGGGDTNYGGSSEYGDTFSVDQSLSPSYSGGATQSTTQQAAALKAAQDAAALKAAAEAQARATAQAKAAAEAQRAAALQMQRAAQDAAALKAAAEAQARATAQAKAAAEAQRAAAQAKAAAEAQRATNKAAAEKAELSALNIEALAMSPLHATNWSPKQISELFEEEVSNTYGMERDKVVAEWEKNHPDFKKGAMSVGLVGAAAGLPMGATALGTLALREAQVYATAREMAKDRFAALGLSPEQIEAAITQSTGITSAEAGTLLSGDGSEPEQQRIMQKITPEAQSQIAKTATQGQSDINQSKILNELNNVMGTGFSMDNLGSTREMGTEFRDKMGGTADFQFSAPHTLSELPQMGTEFRDKMGASLTDLTTVSKIHELSELTGELPAYEKELLDKIKNNAMLNLTEIVNDETADIVKGEISSLVDRGVLRGNIGTQALGAIDEKRTQLLIQGGRDIEASIMEKELGMIGEQKGREMELWSQEQNREMDLLKINEDRWKTGTELDYRKYLSDVEAQQGLWTTESAREMDLAKMKQDLYLEGTQLDLDKYKSDIVWDTSRLNSLTDMWQTEKNVELARSGQGQDWSIAQMQKDAAEDASKWNAWGNIGTSAMWMSMM